MAQIRRAPEMSAETILRLQIVCNPSLSLSCVMGARSVPPVILDQTEAGRYGLRARKLLEAIRPDNGPHGSNLAPVGDR